MLGFEQAICPAFFQRTSTAGCRLRTCFEETRLFTWTVRRQFTLLQVPGAILRQQSPAPNCTPTERHARWLVCFRVFLQHTISGCGIVRGPFRMSLTPAFAELCTRSTRQLPSVNSTMRQVRQQVLPSLKMTTSRFRSRWPRFLLPPKNQRQGQRASRSARRLCFPSNGSWTTSWTPKVTPTLSEWMLRRCTQLTTDARGGAGWELFAPSRQKPVRTSVLAATWTPSPWAWCLSTIRCLQAWDWRDRSPGVNCDEHLATELKKANAFLLSESRLHITSSS